MLGVSVGLGRAASGAVLVRYEGAVDSTFLTQAVPAQVHLNVSMASFIITTVNDGGNAWYGWSNAFANISDSRLSETLNLRFTLTPAPGYQVQVTGVSFDVGAMKTGTADAITAMGMDWSVGGYAASPPLAVGFALDTTADGRLGTAPLSAAITSVPQTQEITFRMFFAGNVSQTAFDNLTLLGNVTLVPEPGSMLTAATLVLLLKRRR
jgi:hypothetical protein